jgi:hypothetical protein
MEYAQQDRTFVGDLKDQKMIVESAGPTKAWADKSQVLNPRIPPAEAWHNYAGPV